MISAPLDTLLLFSFGMLAGVAAGRVLTRKPRKQQKDTVGRPAFYKSLDYILSNEHDKAIEEFTRMVEVDSETVEVYLGLGSLFRSKGELGRAIRIHQSIIVRPSLDKKIKIQAYFDLALDYQKAGLFDSAIETYQTVIQLDPRHLPAYEHLEKVYEDEKSWEKAFEIQKQLQKLAKSKDTMVLAHLQTETAKALQQEERYEEAVRTYRKAIQTDPRCVDAYLHLGDYYHEQKKYLKAIELWEGVAERTPEYAFLTYKRLENSYYELGRYEEMEKIYRRNIERNPDDVETRLVLGDHFFRKGEWEASIKAFQKAIQLQPNCIEAHQKLGEAFLKQGNLDAVQEELKILVDIFSTKYLFYHCKQCGFESKNILWHCPQCRQWDTFLH
jgi:lipopolysaccharide biosynthesis regulator YciM